MILKTSFLCCAAFALSLAPVARAQKAVAPMKTALPEKIGTAPLAQTKGAGVTIQLQRARWASGREVLAWPWMDKALTLWFEAQTVPAIARPDGLMAANYIVNVRLIDDSGRTVEVLPVDTVRSLHRLSMGYVPISPRLELNGQSLWRAQPFDPNFKAVKVQIEWLKPGHPFTSKTMPKSLLELEDGAPVPPAATPWLQKLEMNLPTELIEIGPLQEAPPPILEQENQNYKVALYRWQRGEATVYSNEETRKYPTIQAGLIVTALNEEAAKKLSKQIMLIARNPQGETLKTSSFDNGRYFAPDGKPLKSTQRNFDISLDFDEKPFDITGKWSLEVQLYDNETSLVQLSELPQPK